MKAKLALESTQTFDALLTVLASFSPDGFNKIPFEGSWTGGQVAQHLKLGTANFIELLAGNCHPTERDPDEKIAVLKSIFLDFNSKLKSPDFIDPKLKEYDQQAMLSYFNTLKVKLGDAIPDLDLTFTCADFELPGMGQLTRLEWINFVLFHFQRHTRQLKNIREKVQ